MKRVIILGFLLCCSLLANSQNELTKKGVIHDDRFAGYEYFVDGLRLRSLKDYICFGIKRSEIIASDTLTTTECKAKWGTDANGCITLWRKSVTCA